MSMSKTNGSVRQEETSLGELELKNNGNLAHNLFKKLKLQLPLT